MTELELQVGDDRDQVRVAAALAVAVDRPLHLGRAGAHRGERVGDAALEVVVAVDRDPRAGRADRRDGRARDLLDLCGQRAAVGVAQRDRLRARPRRPCARSAARSRRRRDGRRRSARRRRRRACPRRPGTRSTPRSCAGSRRARPGSPSRGAGASSCPPACRPGRSTRPARAAPDPARPRRSRRRVMPNAAMSAWPSASPASSSKSSSSLGFDDGKPASIEVDAEPVQPVHDAQLLARGQGHARAPHPVAQGGVVELDVARHAPPPIRPRSTGPSPDRASRGSALPVREGRRRTRPRPRA